jgi:tetratricopeptide (TPR) repeat protein
VRDASLLAALGELQVRTGALEAATASYTEAARKSPRDPTLWELVGELHLRQDRPGDALLAFRESLRVKDRAVMHVATARIQLKRGEKRAALESLDKALEAAQGRDPRELSELAGLLADLGRKPDALRLLAQLAGEPGQEKDVALQRRTARLARELGKDSVFAVACARVRKVEPRGACP